MTYGDEEYQRIRIRDMGRDIDRLRNERDEAIGKLAALRAELVRVYLSLPYSVLFETDDEGDVVARFTELKGCTAHGATREEAAQHLRGVQKTWLELTLEAGIEVPTPERLFTDYVAEARAEERACLLKEVRSLWGKYDFEELVELIWGKGV